MSEHRDPGDHASEVEAGVMADPVEDTETRQTATAPAVEVRQGEDWASQGDSTGREGSVGDDPTVQDPAADEADAAEVVTDGPDAQDPDGDAARSDLDTETESRGAPSKARADSGSSPSEPWSEHRARGPALAAVTALVVLVASAAGYYTTVPKTVKMSSRLAGLVITMPGIKTFDVKPKVKEKLTASQSGIAVMKTATKTSPDKTGAYVVGWEPSSSKVAVVVAFVLPTAAQATTGMSQVRRQQLTTGAQKSSSLIRKAAYRVRGVPGSAGALFVAKSSKVSGGLALVAFRVGNVLVETEVSGTAQARQQASSLATREYAHLRRVQPGFSLTKMTYPPLDTVGWGVGTLVLLALIVGSPFLRRRLWARRQRRLQEALDRQLVLGGTVVMKRRR